MPNRDIKNVFLSSIRQDAGKTTVSLGLYHAFKERKIKTAFIKPVGQKYVNVGDVKIDKDSYLIGEVFHCESKFKDMSPVTIARGFTKEYIQHPDNAKFRESIVRSYNKLSRGKDIILIEGTGHAGVGSVIDVSNADVAELLHAKVIIISEGGVGRSIDEIMLNKALFDLKGVEVIGVIINKVLPDKYREIKRILKKGLKNKGLRLLGVLPVKEILSEPTVSQIQTALGLNLLCGKANLSRRITDAFIAAMEPRHMIHHLKKGTLVLTSGDRVDNILLAVSSHLARGKGDKISGIILTGGLRPSPEIMNLLEISQIPILITDKDTYNIAAELESLTCKIQKTDKEKIHEAARLIKRHVNVDAILKLL
ncbi:MAG: AAA family ATPase [Candidatus Omnitrophica bacterium]|nr:AAA family ATPase [Candidatus Omnitrophota bacterium]